MAECQAEDETLVALNGRMHAEEKRGREGLGFFRDLLDQTLRFRRADGTIVTRDEFLVDLVDPANGRDSIDPVEPLTCHVYENTAVASVLLHVAGHNGTKHFDGLFRNIRIFHRDGAGAPWRLKVWFNDAVNPDRPAE